ncbi:hypothetical protein [Micromonospora palomenae]|uniref:hypothetical protein n=1 Tax=Micromonospora palomenae TaxID=1461247 RepID=UPI003F8BB54A
MHLFTLDSANSRINQSIRDALDLDVTHNHGRWIIAAHNRTFATYLLKARGFDGFPSDGKGLLKAKGRDVDALAAAGMFDGEIVVVFRSWLIDTQPVAVVEDSTSARRVGVFDHGGGGCRYIPDSMGADRR